MNSPAAIDIICAEIDALGAHYVRPNRTPAEHARFLKDFVSDLGNVSPEVVRRACQSWRQSEVGKFPTPGQLLKKVEALTPQRERMPGPWKEISPEEYHDLPLAEKIRYRGILANELDFRAGAMWHKGAPVALEDMPPQYHELKKTARGHRDEVNRLRKKLIEAQAREEHSY